MRQDTVNIVIRFDKITDKDGNISWDEIYLKEFLYYGSGGASDAQKCLDKTKELNDNHRTQNRYYMATSVHITKAMKL